MKAAAEEAADKAPKKDPEEGEPESAGKMTVVEDDDDIVEQDDEDDDEEDDEDFENFALEETEEDEEYIEERGDRLEARCRARFLKGNPLSYRQILWQIRGRSYRKALMILEFMPQRATGPILVALQSAAANAQNSYNMDKSRLYISRCKALKGPRSKRMRVVSKSQARPYWRKTTHVSIWVAEMDDDQLERMG